MKKKIFGNKPVLIRNLVLISVFMFLSVVSIRHMVHGGGVAPSVDAICPFGGFESILSFIFSGTLVPRIMISSMILALGVILITIIFSKGFCGQICPFGYFQELLGKLHKPIKFGKRFQMFDKYGRYLKYLILVAVMVGTYYTGTLVFRGYDPYKTLVHVLFSGDFSEIFEDLIGLIVLLVVVVGAIFIPRMWCRYLCPLGAGLNIFGKLSFTKLKRKAHGDGPDKCVSCGLCDKVCPMGIKVTEYETITSPECINCNKCVTVCPKSSITISTFGKKISPILFTVLVVALFFMVIAAAKVIGIWESVPVIEQKDNFDSAEIKGWMSISEVSEMSGISEDYFFSELGMKFDSTIPLKDVKNVYPEFETDLVRVIVDKYNPTFEMEAVNPDAGKCPFGIHDDKYPGDCGLYKDSNFDGECDYSY